MKRPSWRRSSVPGIYIVPAGVRAPERFAVAGKLQGVWRQLGIFRNWEVAVRVRRAALDEYPSKRGLGCVSRARGLTRPYRAFLPGGRAIGFFATEWHAWRAIRECIEDPAAIAKYRHNHYGPRRHGHFCPACSNRDGASECISATIRTAPAALAAGGPVP
jgi:hypothetical protein